jgi:flagellar hook-length control protein FliK
MAAGRGRRATNGQNDHGSEHDGAAQPAPQVRRSVLGAVDTFA